MQIENSIISRSGENDLQILSFDANFTNYGPTNQQTDQPNGKTKRSPSSNDASSDDETQREKSKDSVFTLTFSLSNLDYIFFIFIFLSS